VGRNEEPLTVGRALPQLECFSEIGAAQPELRCVRIDATEPRIGHRELRIEIDGQLVVGDSCNLISLLTFLFTLSKGLQRSQRTGRCLRQWDIEFLQRNICLPEAPPQLLRRKVQGWQNMVS
jgi:hypothetical protein